MNSNVIIDMISIILVCVIVVSEYRYSRNYQGRMFLLLAVNVVGVLLLDIFSWLLDGASFYGANHLLYTINFLFWIAQVVTCCHWVFFSDFWNYQDRERLKKRRLLYFLPMFVELIALFVNVGTGHIFRLNEENCYEHGEWYLLNMIPYYLCIATAFAISIKKMLKSTDEDSKRRSFALTVFLCLPLCGVIFGSFSFGISFIWPFTALSMLMIHIYEKQNIVTEELLSHVRQETELSKLRTSIMLSQIQPHFLYQSLNAIYDLCETDKKKAKEATHDFYLYLKGNLESLGQSGLLPFQTELSHIEIYLQLEKIKYKDRLTVEYDIRAKDFRLPSLTVQPLVENAVKYGVCQREDGGTVWISSTESDQYYEITVKDNGADTGMLDSDGKSQVDIQNIKERLKNMCGGSLILTGEKGEGTTAVIRVPKLLKRGEDYGC